MLRELQTRMFACFAAGALAAGCEYEIDEAAPAYAELKPDPWLADVPGGDAAAGARAVAASLGGRAAAG